ncbi:hypothetical protein XENORESO_001696, partial [Xenotaenia resolanae]
MPSDSWFLLSTSKPILSRRTVGPNSEEDHLPVHPPSFASSRSGVFSPRKKGQFSNWRSQELVGSLPANHRRCGEGLIPLPPYPASHSDRSVGCELTPPLPEPLSGNPDKSEIPQDWCNRTEPGSNIGSSEAQTC